MISFQQRATPAKLSTYCCPHGWVSGVKPEEKCYIGIYTQDLRPTLERLLLTLYNGLGVTTTGYSKVSRGLRFPLEITGLCTSKEYSEASNWGQ